MVPSRVLAPLNSQTLEPVFMRLPVPEITPEKVFVPASVPPKAMLTSAGLAGLNAMSPDNASAHLPSLPLRAAPVAEIGRSSCRERVVQDGDLYVVAVTFKHK